MSSLALKLRRNITAPADLSVIVLASMNTHMKRIKNLAAAILTITTVVAPLAGFAADQKSDAKIKPYILKTCVVSGEKLGEMGKPYVITNDMREIKFCCKDCAKDFKKDPAK